MSFPPQFRGAAVLMGLLAGCGQPKSAPPPSPTGTNAPTPARANQQYHLDHAQPKLRTLKLWLGAEEITAELALTVTEISTGMMFRESMAENEGMLFVFGTPHRTSFYMKNTKIPLSAAYIDPEGVITEIVDLKPLDESPVEAKSDRIQYVLEMNQGWFKRHNVGVGTLLRTEQGSLPETFFRRKP
ncbi:MAG TPA: DUF192 domain-containing protein [Methylomirabilota bacterium]|nr:DUF192 domain-containing protein [Methylomirabilota bacterium]